MSGWAWTYLRTLGTFTAFRCTAHGMSAAAGGGKTGSIVTVLLVFFINNTCCTTTRQGLTFMLFLLFMLLGAICSWVFLPNVQRWVVLFLSKGKDRPGEGRERAARDGEVVGVRDKVALCIWLGRRILGLRLDEMNRYGIRCSSAPRVDSRVTPLGSQH